jgi:WD40 repeat protein
MRGAKLLGIGAAIAILLLAAGNSGQVRTVAAQADCNRTVYAGDSIQRALDNAKPGEIVCVRAGTYQEGLTINKPITLRGEGQGRVIIVGSISVTNAVNVALRGFTLQGGRGLVVVNSSSVTLADLAVIGSEAAGVMVNNSSVQVSQSLISGNKLQGVLVALNSSVVLTSTDITKNGGDGLAVSASKAEMRLNFITENQGCGVKAEGATLTGGSNVIRENAGGNLCGAPEALLGTPLPAPTNLRINTQDWTNQPPLVDWDNPAGAEVGAAWYKLEKEPQHRWDGIRTTQKPIKLENLPEGERSVVIYLWLEDKNGLADPRNRAQGTFTVRIDRTPPRITATFNPPQPSSGWYTTAVTVSFQCEDALSGVASCSSPVTVSQEGKDLEVRGEAVDKAGNRSTTTVRVNIDKTPPTGSLTINDGAASTYSTTVTLRITANDPLSGVAEMRFSNDGRTWSDWESFSSTRSNWDLARYGGSVNQMGPKTVYAQLRDRAGNVSQTFSATIRLIAATLTGHTNWVTSVAFSPDGRLLASGSYDRTIKLWDVASGSLVRTLKGHTSSVFSVAFSPDGRLLASGSADETIKLWDVASGSLVRTLSGHTGDVTSVAFSPDGRLLASGSGELDKTIKLWEVATGKEVRTIDPFPPCVPPPGHICVSWQVYWHSVAFSPDGKLLASGSASGTVYDTIKLWEVASGSLVRTLEGHTGSVYSVAFSPDGRLLASGSCSQRNSSGYCIQGEIKLWEVATGSLVRTLTGHTGWVASVAFSPDGRLLASGSGDIKLWDVASGREVRTLTGHTYGVWSVAFSPDGKLLASGSSDETIKLWDVSDLLGR